MSWFYISTNTISMTTYSMNYFFFCSCIFTIIFAAAMQARPDKTNEISGLMITGIVGGAVVPPIMGFAADKLGNQNGSLLVIGLCMAYLVFCAVRLLVKARKAE